MGKRFYWLKLQGDFFESKRIKKMRRMAGGDTMLVIYLKMQLVAMKNDGIIAYTGLEDSFVEELALDLDEGTEAVAGTLAFLMKTGLCEQQGNDFFFPYAVSNTGSECSSAERVRKLRSKEERSLHCNDVGLHCNDVGLHCNATSAQCNGEKEIEKEKEIDVEEKVPAARSQKHKYGEYKHVLLTDDELLKLNADHSGEDIEAAIRYLDEYIEMKGVKYKSHYLALRKWVFDAVKEHRKDNGGSTSSFDTDSFMAAAVAAAYR